MKIKRGLIFTSIISLVIFVLILIEVLSNGFLVNLDLYINSLNMIKNIFLLDISKIIDLVFDTLSIIIISLFLSIYLCFKYSKKEGAFFSFTILLNAVIIYVIKEVMQRARPSNAIISGSSFAFPSGHTATAVVFFGLLIYLIFRKTEYKSFILISIWISIFMILLVGFTRMYLNLHWFSDVLGGLALGIFVLTICIILKNFLIEKEDKFV